MSTRDTTNEDHHWANDQSGQLPATIVDVHRGKPVRLQVKVVVPTNDHPNYNFVGKLLGPKGNSLKWLQEQTQTKMAILGKGSMRNKEKENELRERGDPKYLHLNEELHVEITAYAPAPEAYLRISKALYEIKRFLVPVRFGHLNVNSLLFYQDYYDDIRKQQLKELGVITTDRTNSNSNNLQLFSFGVDCLDVCSVSSTYWSQSELTNGQVNGSRGSQSQHVPLKNTNKSLKSNTIHSKPYSKPMRNSS